MFLHIAVVSSIVVIANAAKLSPFNQQSLDINECISNKIEAAKPYLADGLPDLSIPSLKHVVLPYSVVNRSNIEFELWNYNITGLENFNILKVDVDLKNNLFKFQIEFPYIQGNGSYGCKGNLFNIKFDGTGPIEAFATKLILNLELKTNIIQRNGHKYLQQVDRDIDITTNGIFHMDLYKLYSGNTKISEILNGIINDNSYYMFEIVVPILENYLDSVLDKATNNFFETYTYDELFP